jgi:hypothetical protein
MKEYSGDTSGRRNISWKHLQYSLERFKNAFRACKINESTDRSIEKRFPETLPKALRTLAKVCDCPRELLRRKYRVNGCYITFCVMNQFWILFEVTSIDKPYTRRSSLRNTISYFVLRHNFLENSVTVKQEITLYTLAKQLISLSLP